MNSSSRLAQTSQPIHSLLQSRHSTRAMAGDGPLPENTLTALLEAARWAPSCGNTQPSRFIVANRDTTDFKHVLETMTEGNKKWAQNASAFIVAVRTTANEKGPLPYGAYDLGQALAHLTVQALAEGLTVRQMAGFDASAVTRKFDLPETLIPMTIAAIGRATDPHLLPEDVRGPDFSPRRRLELSDLILNN